MTEHIFLSTSMRATPSLSNDKDGATKITNVAMPQCDVRIIIVIENCCTNKGEAGTLAAAKEFLEHTCVLVFSMGVSNESHSMPTTVGLRVSASFSHVPRHVSRCTYADIEALLVDVGFHSG